MLNLTALGLMVFGQENFQRFSIPLVLLPWKPDFLLENSFSIHFEEDYEVSSKLDWLID